MKRIAIIGGGISGLTAAYELELARQRGVPLDWHLYEATDRLGGIIETTRRTTPEGEYVLEGGPDGWVSEKPWARELAVELGLESELIYSNDDTRKTYVLLDGQLVPIPDRMRMFVPEDLAALESSPLFSPEAKAAYAAEPARARELQKDSPFHDGAYDESVATFARRHFGEEVLTKIAAPLLSGVFGGDVEKLSVRAVMPQFVIMEREHGSLIRALQHATQQRGNRPAQPIFTALRGGMASLIDALIATLPDDRIHMELDTWVLEEGGWRVLAGRPDRSYFYGLVTSYRTRSKKDIAEGFDSVILATPLDVTRSFSGPMGLSFRELLPAEASSAVLAAFTWSAETASTFTVPPGFGFLVPPPQQNSRHPERSGRAERERGVEGPPYFASSGTNSEDGSPSLLACTFVDQKFPHRAPTEARVLRAFFGGPSAEALMSASDEAVAEAALTQLRSILGPLPAPTHTEVRRWPRSLPQYEVGHLNRMAELDRLISRVPGLTLLGNSYRGVGVPDLIRDARAAARRIASEL